MGGKSRPHLDLIPDRPLRSSVALPNELLGHIYIYIYTVIIHIYIHIYMAAIVYWGGSFLCVIGVTVMWGCIGLKF